MLGVAVSILMQASIITADINNYATAHARTVETGEPLVVLVGADWCPGCRTMKHSVIPQAQSRGMLKGVAFAVVNSDNEPTLARQLMRSSAIPQLIMYRKTADGWKRREVIGAQSLDALNSFLSTPTAEPTEQISGSTSSAAVAGR